MKFTPAELAALDYRRSSSYEKSEAQIATPSEKKNFHNLNHQHSHNDTPSTTTSTVSSCFSPSPSLEFVSSSSSSYSSSPSFSLSEPNNAEPMTVNSPETPSANKQQVIDIKPLQQENKQEGDDGDKSWDGLISQFSATSLSPPSPSPLLDEEGNSAQKVGTPTVIEKDSLVIPVKPDGPTPYMAHHAVGLDCEMVGVGPQGKISVLARVSLVDYYGRCIFDSFVKVEERVTDYRTQVSGVRPEDLQKGIEFGKVRKIVKNILRGKIVVGHGLENDLRALKIEKEHPWYTLRDSATQYQPFLRLDQYGRFRPRRLRDLVWYSLGIVIQQDSKPHCSLVDARAAMALYRYAQENWEYEMQCYSQRYVPSYNPQPVVPVSPLSMAIPSPTTTTTIQGNTGAYHSPIFHMH